MKPKEKYHLPESFVATAVHHRNGTTGPLAVETIETFFTGYCFALIEHLLNRGLSRVAIESAVDSKRIRLAPWPNKAPKTALCWSEDEETNAILTDFADKAVDLCYGRDEYQPIGGTLASVRAEFNDRELALVGLIYAREQGRLRELEFPELGKGGPIYIVRDSFSGRMFEKILPEQK